jgi:hypothetical protein
VTQSERADRQVRGVFEELTEIPVAVELGELQTTQPRYAQELTRSVRLP